MKFLCIGTGGIGKRHAKSLRRLAPDCSFVAVRQEPNETTREFGMAVVPSVADGLALEPDAAIVALPPYLHAPAATAILDAGVPLYLEKPVALDADELEAVARRAETAGVVTMAGCNLRFMTGFRAIKDALGQGVLGDVAYARLSVGQWLPDWRPGRDYRTIYSSKKEQGGGVLSDLIHEIDMARFFFGEFDAVQALTRRSGWLETDCEELAEIILERGDMAVSIHLDCLDRAAGREGRIVGRQGTIKYDTAAKTVAIFDAKSAAWSSLVDADPFVVEQSSMAAFGHFLDCVANRRQSEQPISTGLMSLRLAARVRDAAKATR